MPSHLKYSTPMEKLSINDEECNMIKEYASLCPGALLMLSTNYY